MKSIALAFIALAVFSGKSFCQSAQAQQFGEDIKSWLSQGEHKVDVMSIKNSVTARQTELSNKVRKAMQENAAWIRDSLAHVTDSTVIYAKFGLTKEEFNEYLLGGETKPAHELVKTGDETLVIKRKRNSLTFKGTGRLSALDSLTYNLVLNEPLYNGKELDFSNESGAADSNNPFKTPWKGYHYTYEDYGDILNDDAKNLTATTISFDIGRLETGKTIIMFMLMKFVNGKMIQNAIAIGMFE
ncbi:hypothetical protein [Longitalea luteola]|uniref:hypothetical protein n=1 Tax=Longitalea luteola TaxID=2812563 RepID=UPI001A970B1C|nr:hypothetical protein [Longitalea luteola]